MKPNSLKKNALVIFAAVLIVSVLTAAILIPLGRTFTYYVHEYNPYSDVIPEFKTPGVVEVVSKEKQGTEWKIVFRAVAPGETAVMIDCPHEDQSFALNDTMGTFFRVTKLGTIIEPARLSFHGFHFLCAGIFVCLAFIGVYLFLQYRRQKQWCFFSHDTILHLGLSMFFLLLSLLFLGLQVFCLLHPEDANGELLLFVVQFALSALTLASLPVVLLFSAAVSFSNFWLVRHEGFRVKNLLGVVLGAFLLCGVGVCLILAIANANFVLTIDTKTVILSLVRTSVSVLYLYFALVFFATQYVCVIAARRKPAFDKDYIMILGCAIRKDGTPYPLLKGRIEKAIEFFDLQKKATGKEAMFLPSGGQGDDEVISEAECIRRYLIMQGVEESQILPEAASTSTLENMRFSKALIDERTEKAKVVFSTTNYHAFRSGVLANDVGLDADAVAGKTKLYFWPNAQIREFVALLSRSWKLHLMLCLLLLISSVVLSNLGTIANLLFR